MSDVMRTLSNIYADSGVTRDDIDYETVLSLNAKYHEITAEMPFFFRLNAQS